MELVKTDVCTGAVLQIIFLKWQGAATQIKQTVPR